jgi:hypothetical protein
MTLVIQSEPFCSVVAARGNQNASNEKGIVSEPEQQVGKWIQCHHTGSNECNEHARIVCLHPCEKAVVVMLSRSETSTFES